MMNKGVLGYTGRRIRTEGESGHKYVYFDYQIWSCNVEFIMAYSHRKDL